MMILSVFYITAVSPGSSLGHPGQHADYHHPTSLQCGQSFRVSIPTAVLLTANDSTEGMTHFGLCLKKKTKACGLPS